MSHSLSDLLNFAHSIASKAGKIALRHYQTDIQVEQKPNESPVTAADREAEAFLRAAIGDRYPNHAVLGEEDGHSGAVDAEWRWTLDPIDGTRTFVRGVPLFGVLLALAHEGRPVLGVIDVPALGDRVYAATGLGCYWNGRPCRTSSISCLSESLLVGTYCAGYEQYGKDAAFQRLLSAAGMVRTWGDCYGYVLVATGRAEVAIDPALNPWDAAPLLPILKEAGGTFTDWKGNEELYASEGIATNGHVLAEVLGLIGPLLG